MNAQKLSISFIFYGFLFLGLAAFSFWAKSLESAALFGLAGFGVLTWAHFLNRKHYWSFTALLCQLFIMAALLGWKVLAFFRTKTAGFTGEKVNDTGFMIYSILFVVTVIYLVLSSTQAARIRRELN